MLRGVLLCGGEGTRLRPLTSVVNKHLIRVGKLPMAEYPLMKMIQVGIKEILVVSGGENFAAVVKYFGSGRRWGADIQHVIQDEPGGIAQALSLAKNFVGDAKVLVVLGDNLFSMDLTQTVNDFCWCNQCRVQLYTIQSQTPERFGVLVHDEHGEPCDVVEKPTQPPTNRILTGIYCYSPDVFDVIATLTPSQRGELEITDVNRQYVRTGQAKIVEMNGWWSDCGSYESLATAEKLL